MENQTIDKRDELWAGLKRHRGSITELQSTTKKDREWIRKVLNEKKYRSLLIESEAEILVARLDRELAENRERYNQRIAAVNNAK